ncbi:universal stress protein [Halohasta salina]|uniref:universal stress protein n=1 Tax=Halohasta salina TaxID=2961621 RepID=UPI0020A2C5C5|nr:universal stress protein [Halohasta salina]
MTTFVVPTDSVHTAAALCDYLVDRLGEDDTVHAVSVQPDTSASAAERRDGDDALNAVYARLGAVSTVETHRVDGSETSAAGVRTVAAETEADEIVLGVDGGLGSATEAVVADADCPVVIVPLA